MLELNLINSRRDSMRNKRKALRVFRIFNIFSIFVALIFVGIAFYLFSLTVKIHGNVISYKAQIKNNIVRYNIDILEKQWLQYIDLLTIADIEVRNNSAWAARFQELSRIVPVGVCLEKISILDGGSAKHLALNVLAMTGEKKAFEQVDALVVVLEKSPLFGPGVKVGSHDQRLVGDKAMESFQLIIPVKSL
ncbi:MAG: PilN domain-containing protein [Elusimicrobia bacterium]|nr:PilN domain-containing protein [Elusimicrobiota bacterium]